MMTPYRIVVLCGFVVASGLGRAPAVAQGSSPRVGVLCVLSEQSAYPFGAGTNRCFSEINGKALVPKFSAACFVQGADYTRVTFVYSAVPNPQCGGLAAYGSPATKAQYEPALAALGPQEREFFLVNATAAP